MPRRRVVAKREILPDPKYGSELLAKFINMIMESGKKSVAEKIIYVALDRVADRRKNEPLQVLEQALEHVRPVVEVKSRRVGGATYQVPMEVAPERRLTLAMRWIITASRARSGKSYSEKLAGELMDAAENQGASIRRKEETHKMAEANRAFSHFRM